MIANMMSSKSFGSIAPFKSNVSDQTPSKKYADA